MAKRTIEEVYTLLNEKIENALNQKHAIYEEMKKDEIKEQHYDCIYQRLQGEIEAYTDVKILIETSGLIKSNNDKAFEELFFKETVVTYEDKMEYLEKRRQWLKGTMDMILKLHPQGDHRTEDLQHKLDIIECIMEDIRDFKEVNK